MRAYGRHKGIWTSFDFARDDAYCNPSLITKIDIVVCIKPFNAIQPLKCLVKPTKDIDWIGKRAPTVAPPRCIKGWCLGPSLTIYSITIHTCQNCFVRIMLRNIASDNENEWIFERNHAWITSGRRRIFQWSDFDVITVQFGKLCKGCWLFVVLKTKDLCLDLNSVDINKVETLVNYSCDFLCLGFILKQSSAVSDANLPDKVQRNIDVYFSLNSTNSNSVEKFVEFLCDDLC